MTLSIKLRTLRYQKGMSQAELAQLLGITQSTYGTWEHNVYPKSNYMPKLAEIFEISIEELLTTSTSLNQTLPVKLEIDALTEKLIKSLERENKTKDELIIQLKEELGRYKRIA